jgi:hypothetical protein
MKKTTRAMTAMLLIALLVGIMSMAVQAAPQGFDRCDSDAARFTRHDGVTFSYFPNSTITIATVNMSLVDGVNYRTLNGVERISADLVARGYSPVTRAELTNFLVSARAFNAGQNTQQQPGQQQPGQSPQVSVAPYFGDNPVLVPEWWFHGDRYANLTPGENRTNPAPLMRDMRNVLGDSASRAGGLTANIAHMPHDQRHDDGMRAAMQNNFSEFGTNFPFNQAFFDRMTGSDRLRNVVFTRTASDPLGRYGGPFGGRQQAIIATAVNNPPTVPAENTQFFELMRHFSLHSSMAGGATMVATGGQHRPTHERNLLDYHTFLEQMLVQRISEVEFLATAFWGNEDRLNHHVQNLFGPYGFTLEDIQYARTYDRNIRDTTGQRINRSLLIDSFINAFCQELNLTPQQRTHYKNIARAEIDRLSARAQQLGLTRQNAFMGVTNGQNPTGLEMIPMQRSHLDPFMFPSRQYYLDAKTAVQ